MPRSVLAHRRYERTPVSLSSKKNPLRIQRTAKNVRMNTYILAQLLPKTLLKYF